MAYEIGLSTPEVPNRGFPLWVCSVVFVIVAGMFVMTRLAVRFHYRGLGTDDWMILASLIGSIILSVTQCMAVHHGYGKHSRDLSEHDREIALKWIFVAQVMYKVVITINKTSFLCLYLRIFIQPVFRWLCFAGIAFLNCWGLGYILVTIFQCRPIAYFWDKSIANPNCVDTKAQWLSYAIINIVCDALILIMPLYPISQLRLPRAKRFGLAGIIALGAFVCVISIIRTTTLAESANNQAKDATSGPIPAVIWSVVEANTGIICACLPVFKQPLQYVFPNLFSSQESPDPTDKKGARPTRSVVATDPFRRGVYSASGWWHHMSSHGLDVFHVGGREKPPLGITQITDVHVTYQDDTRSDASWRPMRGYSRMEK
ncbi:hypothetical protein BDW42DRAFT_202212 [Aspergillus taichungensis]|uniref:Rhodopsin domain-containing protein n=1 Tax=Aspergillus taichungensis TaxID=482145 RepID=A0A2J5HMD1_9EURO|nr:hypothetical protein BDW42DRAFT_202212 [Aspergillus taichungensis]